MSECIAFISFVLVPLTHSSSHSFDAVVLFYVEDLAVQHNVIYDIPYIFILQNDIVFARLICAHKLLKGNSLDFTLKGQLTHYGETGCMSSGGALGGLHQ